MTQQLQRISNALEGRCGDDQRAIAETICRLGDKLLRKNADYGSSVFRPPVLCPDLPADTAIRVRLSDKIERLRNLLDGKESQVPEEPIAETVDDMIGHAVLWLASFKLAE